MEGLRMAGLRMAGLRMTVLGSRRIIPELTLPLLPWSLIRNRSKCVAAARLGRFHMTLPAWEQTTLSCIHPQNSTPTTLVEGLYLRLRNRDGRYSLMFEGRFFSR
ncbi:unnamed protein product [Closterium sp. Naga37s-1]|nr:unnamed protein product [Closterium sp. Naga37s-1]